MGWKVVCVGLAELPVRLCDALARFASVGHAFGTRIRHLVREVACGNIALQVRHDEDDDEAATDLTVAYIC